MSALGVHFNEVSVKRELTVYESQDSMGFHNPHEISNDTPLNPVPSILKVFYYSLIITCIFCPNYKVGESSEFSGEELGVKDEQQIDLEGDLEFCTVIKCLL